ncbi:hypothetical protein NL676_011855 [Syzygium grande]|nr:hypothetical protein NL676_011855 [Syzygium grande]
MALTPAFIANRNGMEIVAVLHWLPFKRKSQRDEMDPVTGDRGAKLQVERKENRKKTGRGSSSDLRTGQRNASLPFGSSEPPHAICAAGSTQKLAAAGEMASNGPAPPRGSAAAAASMRRRRTTGGGASGGATGTMLQFYTDDAPGLKISPNVVLVMSIGFIAFVAILHVIGKLYLVRR